MNEEYCTFTDKVYVYPDRFAVDHPTKKGEAHPFAGCLGWDAHLVKCDPAKPSIKHPCWEHRQPYVIEHPRAGKKKVQVPLSDFPIYTAPGQVLLVGLDGVPCTERPWALTIEFQFAEFDAQAYVGKRKYSVLVSSYKNNSIVARICGTLKTPGIQLMFIKKDAFESAASLLDKCLQYEKEGRYNDRLDPASEDAEHERLFPRGTGKYSVTPFIPMEQCRWYSLQIQGQRLQTAMDTGDMDDELYRLVVRVDPMDPDTGAPVDDQHKDHEVLQYERGKLIPSDRVTEAWKRSFEAKFLKPKISKAKVPYISERESSEP
jgi:hypothetical protein